MFIIYRFLALFSFYNLFWSLIPKHYGNVCHYIIFLDVTSSCLSSLVQCLKFTLRNIAAKTGNQISLVLKDSDTESENLSSLIWLSVSDSQKTDSSKDIVQNMYHLWVYNKVQPLNYKAMFRVLMNGLSYK